MKDLNKKTEKELEKILADKRKDLREVRFGSSGSKDKNVKGRVNIRKETARILTELRIREIKSK
ncbi:hypothetical protein A2442_04205 [Candidatus Campbellbacteria bacterium RIFOXYC2_FULL_35_25]|uniref:Large ribosomal subunit protein uL29 n=1 Tax=Candidatus Campbellbacteria bacterium RIFOXYC2_FULL_35_25 TaxID=1797582 RepID=A0A1F5EIP8_9BACT|nr:MAG: hypothetical protein A2442_04205 [Candidatus Campbellbacteria bacterium RIFOXYC2_FULL_35_25]